MAATSVWKIAGITERVVAMWTVEQLSAGVIARTISAETGMPLSRSAVMGRIGVLGLRRSALGAEAPSATKPENETDLSTEADIPATAPATIISAATIVSPKINTPAAGAWPIAALREGQCRFACTGHNVPADQHRFCGQPTEIGPGNLHGSWCPEHLERMYDRTSRLARPAFLKAMRGGR